jgi:uncharacterized protein YbbC (DUF1343 family)
LTHSLLKESLELAVSRSGAPGVVACVGIDGSRVLAEAVGFRQLHPKREATTLDTIYDLASLTKMVATTTAVMILRDEGKLDLDHPVSRYIPLPNMDRFKIRHLITHTTGLPAWRPWYQEVSGFLDYLERISEAAGGAVPDQSRTYSDMGFILLRKVVEQAAQDTLENFCTRKIYKPLGMNDTMFNPPKELHARCAPTEYCSWRKRALRGEVHDENASSVGGVSGHAGLFSTVLDLEKFCVALLSGKILSEATMREVTAIGSVPFYPWQGIGWWVDPWAVGANGYLPSRTAFGHTGFTGTSIWMDWSTKLYVILLSNTCHPSREERDNTALRRTFHSRIADVYYPRWCNAHTGLDKLLRNEFKEVQGKRLALLTNSAAVDQMGRTILDVFALNKSLKLKYLYSPEHGLFGKAEAGEQVASEKGESPIISLYGDRKQPSREELGNVDLFVIDLPDVGARYYTYMATMKDCLVACAENNTPVLLLDRPNPVGGLINEGPIATETGTPVCSAPIPIRHGMTLGELALYFQKNALGNKKLDLTVLTAENWWTDLQAPESSLPWQPPSPNIPTADTALMYVGTCLFEGLNINEGRGTETPFLVCGAPWLDAEAVIGEVAQEECVGCTLETILYIPKSIPGKASNPKHKDKLCRGIRFSIIDRHELRPFTTALAVICAIHRKHKELDFDPFFDTLAGGFWLREQILAGRSALGIVQEITPALVRFDAERPHLYSTLLKRKSNP